MEVSFIEKKTVEYFREVSANNDEYYSGEFLLNVKKCQFLPSSKLDKTDAYVKFQFNGETKKTKEIKDNANPVFDQQISFKLNNVRASTPIAL